MEGRRQTAVSLVIADDTIQARAGHLTFFLNDQRDLPASAGPGTRYLTGPDDDGVVHQAARSTTVA